MRYTSTSSTKVFQDDEGNKRLVTLKKPYEEPSNLKSNKDGWTALGGWPEANNKLIADAKKGVENAVKYVKITDKRKEMSEIACPCEGEPYFLDVQNNAGRLAEHFGEQRDAEQAEANKAKAEMEKLAAQASSYGSDAAASLNNKALDSDAHHSSWATFKKMRAKYGKLGPQSTWQPRHESQLKHAKNSLKVAQKIEDQAMETALPEFHKVKQEFPEVFANGKCPCPMGWTIQDAAVLAEKLKEDAVEEASHIAKRGRHMKNNPGEWYDPVSGKSWDNDANAFDALNGKKVATFADQVDKTAYSSDEKA